MLLSDFTVTLTYFKLFIYSSSLFLHHFFFISILSYSILIVTHDISLSLNPTLPFNPIIQYNILYIHT